MKRLTAKEFGAPVGRYMGCFNENCVVLTTKEVYMTFCRVRYSVTQGITIAGWLRDIAQTVM